MERGAEEGPGSCLAATKVCVCMRDVFRLLLGM